MIKIVDSSEIYLEEMIESSLVANDELDLQLEELQYHFLKFVENYERKYKTTIQACVFLGTRFSWYGAIGRNGAMQGEYSEGLDLREVLSDCDDFQFSITSDRTLQLEKHDHDGTNTMQLRLVTENELLDYYDHVNDYFNLAEYILEIGKKPTKVFNSFKKAFEYKVSLCA
ncbi:hypothetical protein [Staphylococcus hyicus]|uniref:hypothetical protein n=1 Tax=Staphylococcus hyicus TaxID=1284 RepID=UPI003132C5B2